MQLSTKIKSADYFILITRNALKEDMEALLSSYIHGYHVIVILDSSHWRETYLYYKKWGCVLLHDNPTVVGHLLRTLSRICSSFSFHGGTIIRIELQARRYKKLKTREIK